MTVKEWAEKLNGREYAVETTQEEEKQMKEDGVIAAFGASDDLLEFRGVLDDEFGVYEGGTALLYRDNKTVGLFIEEDNEESAEFNRKQIAKMLKVKAIWCPKDEDNEVYASWEIETAIPHDHFDIMEDGEIYCRGIVFRAEDVPKV
jgi:hypothetical protein